MSTTNTEQSSTSDIDRLKSQIIDNISNLCYDDRCALGKLLVQSGYKIYLTDTGRGVIINLDVLSNESIRTVHTFIENKLDTNCDTF